MKKFMQAIQVCVILIVLGTELANAQILLNASSQPQFANPLPVPSVIDGRNGGTFTIGVSQFNQWLGLINPVNGEHLLTTVWGYNGSYPGPTVLAKKNIPISVFWRNNLIDGNNAALPHLLPIDRTIDWALAKDADRVSQ